jgi:tetratricopeptide (TPR) repeat protein
MIGVVSESPSTSSETTVVPGNGGACSFSIDDDSKRSRYASDEEGSDRSSPTSILDLTVQDEHVNVEEVVVDEDEDDDIISDGPLLKDDEDIFVDSHHEDRNDNDIKSDIVTGMIVADLKRQHQEGRYRQVSILPTIEEITASEEEQGETKDGKCYCGNILVDDISSHIRPLAVPSPKNDIDIREVRLIMDKASLSASRGNEDNAIVLYKGGLKILKRGLKRLSRQMESAASKPTLEKTALYIALHEEWSELALVIAEIRTMMAIVYERKGEYDKSIICCEEARTVYHRQSVFDERHHKRGSDARANQIISTHMIRKLEEARESSSGRKAVHETIDRIYEKIVTTTNETSLQFLYEDIFDKISVVLSLEVVYLGDMHPQVADSKELLSMLFSGRGRHQEAVHAMNHAVHICEVSLGDQHPRTGLKYKNAAKMYEKFGGDTNRKTAIEFYEKSIATFKKAEGESLKLLCGLLNDVGVLYIQQKDYDMAATKLDEALEICDKSTDLKSDAIQVWLNLAECHSWRKEIELATDATRNALHIQKKLRESLNKSNSFQETFPALLSSHGIALTLKRLGKCLVNEKKFDLAYGALLEALSILQTNYGIAEEVAENDPNVDLPGQQDEIASALYCLAEAKQLDKKYMEAITLYQESLQLRLNSDKIRGPGKKVNRVHCAMSLFGVGTIQLQISEPSEAFKSFNEGIHYVRKEGLPESHPIVQMLWDKSHMAASKMFQDQNSSAVSKTGVEKRSHSTSSEGHNESQTNAWSYTISHLEEKAKAEKEIGEIEECIKTMGLVVEMQRKYLAKRRGSEKSRNKAKQHLAASLLSLGRIELLACEVERGTICFKEALCLCKSSELNNEDAFVQEIEKNLQGIRQQFADAPSPLNDNSKAEF